MIIIKEKKKKMTILLCINIKKKNFYSTSSHGNKFSKSLFRYLVDSLQKNVELFFTEDKWDQKINMNKFSHILWSGSPCSVHKDTTRMKTLSQVLKYSMLNRIPLFAICYGMQALVVLLRAGDVKRNRNGFYENDSSSNYINQSKLLTSSNKLYKLSLQMQHKEHVTNVNKRIFNIVGINNAHVTMIEHHTLPIFASQFHLSMSKNGQMILEKFLCV